jgi:enoyl-[acyl-carrier-protein] reductase (NADH)
MHYCRMARMLPWAEPSRIRLKRFSFVKGLHALKRLAEPGEIANSALYLASGLSSFTTGKALLADGGVSINRT